MGTLTLTELKAELLAGLGNRGDMALRLTRFLNLAQTRLARLVDFEEMEVVSTPTLTNTGSSTDKYYTLPNLREMYSFRITQDGYERKLDYLTRRLFDKQIPAPEVHARGTPAVYTLWAQRLELFQLPDQSYTTEIRWTKWPTALTDSAPNAVSEFDNKDDAIIEMALCYAFWSLGKEDEAKRHEARALQLASEGAVENDVRPDAEISIDRTPRSSSSVVSRPWADPFVSSTDGGSA